MKIVQFLIIVTLISLPLYVVRCNSFSWCSFPIPVTLLELLILLSFSAWFIWRIYTIQKGEINLLGLSQRLRGPFFWPLVIFLGVATISLFLSPDLRSGAGVWKAYFIEPALLYFVVLDLSVELKSIRWIIYSLLFSAFWVSILAVWQFFTKVDQFAPDSIGIGRVTSVFNNPNALGLYLGPVFLMGLGAVLEKFKEGKESKYFYAFCMIVILILILLAILLSKSRGSGIGIVVAVLFFGFILVFNRFSSDIKVLIKRVFYILLALFVTILLFSFLNIDKFVPEDAPNPRNSAYTRLCIWQATRDLLKENYLFGTGLSGYPQVYPKYATCEGQAFKYPHNIFLNFWVELGMAGLIVFFWISYRYYAVTSRYLDKAIPLGLLSILVYILVHGLVDVPYFKNDLSVQFWVLLAMVSWYGALDPKT